VAERVRGGPLLVVEWQLSGLDLPLLTIGGGPGWEVAFVLLALGPAIGIVARGRLRGMPEALRMAGGHR
jgi:hypothetical protein